MRTKRHVCRVRAALVTLRALSSGTRSCTAGGGAWDGGNGGESRRRSLTWEQLVSSSERGRRMFRAIALTIALLTTPLSAQSQAQDAFPRSAVESVVTIRVYGDSGVEIGLGSGFFIADGRVVTNAHVVEGAAWVEVYDREDRFLLTTTHVSVISTRLDVAILPAPSNPAPGLPIRDVAPDIGESIWVIGSPQGLTGSVSNGVVSAERTSDGRTLLQITAPISPGSSGGPVLDSRGRVLGIASSFLGSGQNLNFAVPASDLVVLAEGPGSELSFPQAAPQVETAPVPSSTGPDWVSSEPALSGFSRFYSTATDLVPPVLVRTDSLTSRDASLNAHHFDLFRFFALQGETLRISVVSDDFDPIVKVYASEDLQAGVENGWSLENDDGGEGLNSLMDVTFPRTGFYTLRVAPYGPGGSGTYYLLIWDQAMVDTASSVDEARPEPRPDSDRWTYAGTANDDSTWWVDLRGMRNSGGLRSAWILQLKASPTIDPGGEPIDESRTLFDYDCSNWRSRLRSLVTYHQGAVVTSLSWEAFEADWTPTTPDTMGEGVIELVCGG